MSVGNKLIQAAAGNVVGDQVDANFSDTTLLLQGDMTNVTMSYNAFGDASDNAHDITPVGGVHGTPFSPYNESWSVEFDGSGDYLQVASDATLSLDGDFTIEWWMYRESDVIEAFFTLGDSKLSTGIEIYVGNSGNNLYTYSNDAIQISSTTLPAISSWSHLALVRSGTTITMYLDGSSLGTWTSASATFSGNLYIGAEFYNSTLTGSTVFAGYLSNLRVVKGTAVYTSAFTPSTTPLTDVSGTSLLTCNASRFIDTSSNDHTITVNGDPEIKGFSPFADTDTVTGSGYFDGSGDYLSGTLSTGIGTNDFTIEMWAYVSPSESTSNPRVFTIGGNNNSGGITLLWTGSGFRLDLPSTTTFGTSTGAVKGEWYHIAVTRNSGTAYFFVNGTQITSASNSANLSATAFNIAADEIALSGYDINGYISNVRVVNGTAVYTSAFTPPTSPLTAVTNTSLLTLQNRGANRNIGFIDSSHPSRQITRNGNVTQGSFSPFSQDEGKWGNYFANNDSYLTIADNSSFDIASNANFTFETWFYCESYRTVQNQYYNYMMALGTTSGHYVLLSVEYDGKISGAYKAGTGYGLKSNSVITLNQWTHVALVRESNTLKLYVDGVLQTDSDATAGEAISPGTGFAIGTSNWHPTNEHWDGYISNLRFVNGTAIYTSAFTPSTEPLTAVTNTELLTCQSNRFVDNSSSSRTVSTSGTPEVAPFSPFAPSTAYDPATKGGSGYFDGSGDYLDLSSDIVFGTSDDFTVECWVYTTATDASGYNILFSGGGGNVQFSIHPSNGNLGGYLNGYLFSTSGTAIKLNTWQHVAWTRSGGTGRGFVDGVLIATGSHSQAFNIGRIGKFSGAGFEQNGYMTDVRIIKGEAVYTSNFTPPTAPLTAVSGTSFLCNFTNAGIYDGTGRNVLETVGDAHVENSVKKYGTGSMQFDGTGDYLLVPASEQFSMGTGDFTAECWFYANSTSARGLFQITTGHLISQDTGIALGVSSNTGNPWRVYHGTTATDTSSNLVTGSWQHIAIVRNGTAINIYLDGTSIYSATDASDLSSYQVLTVGAWYSSSFPWNGYIDDFRITKGVARYTANFTPPAAKLPNL